MNRLGTQIEILNATIERGRIRHALFDFDGTLSLVREGWQAVMLPMMLEKLLELKTGENEADLENIVREFVTRLTGKQTIYQMIELADQIKQRGGTPREPLEYKHEYLARLESRIAGRIADLESGKAKPAEMLVPGSIELLENLKARGCRIYLASGTDEPFVLREARLLQIDGYFDGGIFGAMDDYRRFSKKLVIDEIIAANSLNGPELVGIGDGYVEIENTKQVGGIALGVPTFEAEPFGFDEWKKSRLALAGADLLVPNFLEQDLLLDYLFAA